MSAFTKALAPAKAGEACNTSENSIAASIASLPGMLAVSYGATEDGLCSEFSARVVTTSGS